MRSIQYTGDPRLHWSKKYEDIYHTLKDKGIFPQNAQTFMFCASLGFKYDRSLPISSHSNDIRLATFTEPELISYVTIAFSKAGMQFDKLGQIEEFRHIMEEYAEGGMQVFIERFLSAYLVTSAEDTLILDIKSSAFDFEKDLLVFITGELQNYDPF
ncbi:MULTISPECIES: hypothetical protein [unclassified Paenibacillus]|uniref:hypothetical protein n=1 Tax=unclassified Paenibacillus TaxID=185978 RepID=UPI001AE17F1D|nr:MULTISPECIES: hypothetical protein [unclassified Paenibacillus]MBP1154020.1 dnd system-associated protein 4 [Paenibacillus sp. PvP091]MBP1170595.1 dnd system-associated protein 4 [Paenibacillus sp. PvR098]MBP2441623.1 dnd system-associated protein 4 [Paenibacillus sp. PvP052]